jgi:hypothetical protein
MAGLQELVVDSTTNVVHAMDVNFVQHSARLLTFLADVSTAAAQTDLNQQQM